MIIVDENLSGEKLSSRVIDFLSERLSVREIIRARIWQEVQEYNAQAKALPLPHALVKPAEEEERLNGKKGMRFKPVDWEKQYNVALRAFESNGFFILVGDRQAESLDEEFDVEADTEVSFVKLTLLVGG